MTDIQAALIILLTFNVAFMIIIVNVVLRFVDNPKVYRLEDFDISTQKRILETREKASSEILSKMAVPPEKIGTDALVGEQARQDALISNLYGGIDNVNTDHRPDKAFIAGVHPVDLKDKRNEN